MVSGGERRRIALARTFLANAPVMVLDEPTAHLDPAMAEGLMADVLAQTAGRSVLVITHRSEGLEARGRYGAAISAIASLSSWSEGIPLNERLTSPSRPTVNTHGSELRPHSFTALTGWSWLYSSSTGWSRPSV